MGRSTLGIHVWLQRLQVNFGPNIFGILSCCLTGINKNFYDLVLSQASMALTYFPTRNLLLRESFVIWIRSVSQYGVLHPAQ